jgi:predicted small lipoprotein YifL
MKKLMLMSSAVAMTMAMAGCGGGSPLTIWLVSADPNATTTCTPAETTKSDQTDVTTGIGSGEEWQVYKGPKGADGNDTYYLDTGGNNVLIGTLDGSHYKFTGADTKTDLSPSADAPTATVTDVTTTTVEFIVDGSSFTGTSTSAFTSGCTGPDCPTGNNPPPCSQARSTTTNIAGTKVDAELRHNI